MDETLKDRLATAREKFGAPKVAVDAGISVAALQQFITGKIPKQLRVVQAIETYLASQGL